MIKRLDISGIHTKLDKGLEKYVTKKIGNLDQYVPRQARESLHVEVRLKDHAAKDKNHCTCKVVFHLPQETIDINETAETMYAAIDLVETKFKVRLKKYKELHTNPRLHRRLLARLKRQPA